MASTGVQPALVTEPPAKPRGGANWIWFPVAAVLLLFANGRDTIPLAAWLAPVFLVRFARSHRPRALVLVFLAWTTTAMFQFRGMFPLPLSFFAALAAALGLVATLMYALDRWLAPRIGGLAGTLVFPVTWAAADFLNNRWSIFGSWGSVAYTQYGNLPLVQIVSVTGLYGVVFLMAWFATVVNWAWEQGFTWPRIRRAVLAYILVMLAVLFYGGWRLSKLPTSPMVRVASLSHIATASIGADFEDLIRLSHEEFAQTRGRMRARNDDLLMRSEREAAMGAKIIFWGEGNALVFKEDEPELIQRGQELARSRKIYLGMGIRSLEPGKPKPVENKLVLIDPEGKVLWTFLKAHPVPGQETPFTPAGDGLIKVSSTRYGRLGGVICFDGAFPELLKQAGRLRADIMLDPAYDWLEIDPWNAQMASFRAVEEGFNLVRQASSGMSLAVDYTGRVQAAMDYFTSDDPAMVAQVPTGGVRTLYGRFGDWFGWLCLAALVALAFRGVTRGGTPAPGLSGAGR